MQDQYFHIFEPGQTQNHRKKVQVCVIHGNALGLHDDFGRHPKRSADKCVAFADRCRQLPGDAEICELHVAIGGQQYVCRLGRAL